MVLVIVVCYYFVIVIVTVNGQFFSRYFAIFVIVIVNVNNTAYQLKSVSDFTCRCG